MIIRWPWRFWIAPRISGILMLLLSLSSSLSCRAIAADVLTLRVSGWQRSFELKDLEYWQKTGEIPPHLDADRWLLTPKTQQLLGQRLNVDSAVAIAFLEQIEKSGDGKKLLQQLTTALPNTTEATLKAALIESWQQNEDFRFLSFVRAYPAPNLTVDLAKLTEMGIQVKSASWQGQLLRPYLRQAFQSSTVSLAKAISDPSQVGEQSVQVRTLFFEDIRRKRRIPLDIYTGKTTENTLVVMSHGFAADRRFGMYLAHHLASHGFTVVSLEHPGSNIQALVDSAWGVDSNEILSASEFIERPQDVRFVLDRLARLNRLPPFQNQLPTQSVVMVGHSFGGYTAFALAGATLDLKRLRQSCQRLAPLERSPADWLQCSAAKLPYAQLQFKDARIKGIIALNPITGELFKDLSQVTVPSLILSSSDDGITPIVSHQLRPFQQLKHEKYLILAMGATHMSVTDVSNLDSAIAQSTLVREVMGEEAKPVREGVKGVTLAFLKQFSSEALIYRPYLSDNYLRSFATPQTQLYLSQKLPLTLKILMPTLDIGTQTLTRRSPFLLSPRMVEMRSYFNHAQQMLNRPEYCTRQVDDMFTALLKNFS